MMSTRNRGGAVLLALATAALSVQVPARAAQVRERDQTWSAPAGAASRANPLAQNSEVGAGGAKLFRQRCATCHGEKGQGTSKAPGLAAADVQSQSDGALFWKISSGNTRGGMPAFSFLPEPQRWQVVLHVRTLR